MTIQASEIVNVNPGVIGSGGSPLSLNGVILSTNSLLPAGKVQFLSTSDASAAVSDFFGPASDEFALAKIYTLGFDNSTIKPDTIIFAPYHDADVGAWLQSGSFEGVTLTQLQAITPGTLIITVDGSPFTSSSINLSAATSFSNAATIIDTAITGSGSPTVTWNSVNSTFTLHSPLTGASSTITYCTGTIATGLKFTSATSAIISQGADADTPASAMDNVKANTQDWVDFTTMFEPSIDDKELFAVWTNEQNQRYAYIAWDTDGQAVVNGSTTNFGYVVNNLKYDGIVPISGDATLAAEESTTLAALVRNAAVFTLGAVASIDYGRVNGRITAAFKHQSGLAPTVDDTQTANILLANGYSFYGKYAEVNNQFNFLYNGQMSGRWKWLDTFINQVYLNSQFRLAMLTYLTSVNSVPYNPDGYNSLRLTMQDPINQALNNGSIRTGVTLSQSQKAQLIQAAGLDISMTIEQQGYYLQILDPGAQVRGERGSPIINFWYTDGGAIQKITIASIDIM